LAVVVDQVDVFKSWCNASNRRVHIHEKY